MKSVFRDIIAIYVTGSILGNPDSLASWFPRDLDLFLVSPHIEWSILMKSDSASIFIIPHPSRTEGLIPTPLWGRPSQLSTLMFLVEPKHLLLGESIERYLCPIKQLLADADRDLDLWIEEKLEAYGYWISIRETRNATKNLARAIWGYVVVLTGKPTTVRKSLKIAGECGSCIDKVLGFSKPSVKAVEECKEICLNTIKFIVRRKMASL